MITQAVEFSLRKRVELKTYQLSVSTPISDIIARRSFISSQVANRRSRLYISLVGIIEIWSYRTEHRPALVLICSWTSTSSRDLSDGFLAEGSITLCLSVAREERAHQETSVRSVDPGSSKRHPPSYSNALAGRSSSTDSIDSTLNAETPSEHIKLSRLVHNSKDNSFIWLIVIGKIEPEVGQLSSAEEFGILSLRALLTCISRSIFAHAIPLVATRKTHDWQLSSP